MSKIEEFKKLLENSWKSIRVVGRGTVVVDIDEVRKSPEMKRELERAKGLVK